MSLSPEARAKALFLEMALALLERKDADEAKALIASAIRAAEDEALERAAERLERSPVCACQLCTGTIRSLKSGGGR